MINSETIPQLKIKQSFQYKVFKNFLSLNYNRMEQAGSTKRKNGIKNIFKNTILKLKRPKPNGMHIRIQNPVEQLRWSFLRK